MNRVQIILAGISVLIAANVSAFDGNRKGFVLGGGLGVTPLARYSLGSQDETKAGLAADILIGYAWDERNMIVYEGNGVGYFLDGSPENENLDVMQQYNGFSWFHYFNPGGQSIFTLAGIGIYSFGVEDGPDFDPGAAYLLGGGYQFARHVQVGVYFSGGRTSYHDSDYGHNHLSIIVSAIAF